MFSLKKNKSLLNHFSVSQQTFENENDSLLGAHFLWLSDFLRSTGMGAWYDDWPNSCQVSTFRNDQTLWSLFFSKLKYLHVLLSWINCISTFNLFLLLLNTINKVRWSMFFCFRNFRGLNLTIPWYATFCETVSSTSRSVLWGEIQC